MDNSITFHFTNEKAGMQGLNKEEIDKIIFEATKDSAITRKKIKDFERIKQNVEHYQVKLKSFHNNEALFEQNKKLAEARLKELRSNRTFDRVWMHIDMDMFYAAVEIRDDPSLKDKPVAIGGEEMISTSNYVARRFGIRSAMPGFIGKKLCKDLVFVNCNFHKYKVKKG